MSVNSFEHYPMSWKPDFSRAESPLYLALAKLLEEDIKKGVLPPGTKLPPQRELADFLDINLSTVSRAFRICSQKGLLSSSVGNGTYVSADATAGKIFVCGKENPKLIEMGGIYPHEEANLKVQQFTEQLLKGTDALKFFSYAKPQGTKKLREAGVIWFGKMGFHTDSGHIILAAGGQNALTAVLCGLFQQGDKIGTDDVTYPGIKMAARMAGIQLVPVRQENYEMTEEGINYAIKNENIKGIYIIPDFQNPTGHIMSLETRKMIAEVSEKNGLIVIEDAISHLLNEHADSLPPVAAFAPENVICLASLSKTVAPGLRTAFIHVPRKYHSGLAEALYTMNLSNSAVLTEVAAGLIESGQADEIIAERREEIAKRNIIANKILNGYLAESELTCPFRWLLLPECFTGEEFEICARREGVEVFGAERFTVGNRPAERAVRISVITPPTAEILTEGLGRLQKILVRCMR